MTEIHTNEYSSQSDSAYDPSLTGEFVEGFDLEVADDLGIATNYESLQEQIESGNAVGRLTISKTVGMADGAQEHAQIVAEEGFVRCATCNKPGCPGCGRS